MKNFDKSKIMDALIKRAEGFYYNEEILEYSCEDKKVSNNDNLIDENKNLKNSVSKSNKNENYGVDLNQGGDKRGKKIKENENQQSLILVKKKVTTHYVPPDMSALKILVENYGQEIKSNDVLENLNDEQLINLRNEILKSLDNN